MNKIRALVNAELISENEHGEERTLQIGSGTYFEANKVETYLSDDKGVLADITLLDGFQIIGVAYNQQTFENHGVPEYRITKSVKKAVEGIANFDDLTLDDFDKETLEEFHKQWGNNPTN